MAEPILRVDNLKKAFGEVYASDGLSFDVRPGEVHALIGPNGAGKSTAVAQIYGEVMPDSGDILFEGKSLIGAPVHARAGLGMQRSYQITSLFLDMTAADNVAMAVQALSGHSFQFWRPARLEAALRVPAEAALERAGIAHLAARPVGALSHGERRQLELAMVLAGAPKLLLLDEPMAGIGQSESRDMMERLRALKGDIAILLVEHDMDVVFALADRVTVMVKGSVLMSGSPDAVRADTRVRDAYLGAEG